MGEIEGLVNFRWFISLCMKLAKLINTIIPRFNQNSTIKIGRYIGSAAEHHNHSAQTNNTINNSHNVG
jgi:hypothetical protein